MPWTDSARFQSATYPAMRRWRTSVTLNGPRAERLSGITALLHEAAQNPWLQRTDVDLNADEKDCLAVFVAGRFRGSWRWDGVAYAWIPAGYRLAHVRVACAADAARHLAHTLEPRESREPARSAPWPSRPDSTAAAAGDSDP